MKRCFQSTFQIITNIFSFLLLNNSTMYCKISLIMDLGDYFMSFTLTRLSSLEKIFPNEKYINDYLESVTLLKGQSYSYQIAISSDDKLKAELSVISPLKDYIKLYEVKNVYADFPAYPKGDSDDDYITKEPALIPDALIHIDTENAYSVYRFTNTV